MEYRTSFFLGFFLLSFFPVYSFSLLPSSASQIQSPAEDSIESLPHSRASIRYTTPKGIGYKDGYTTIEGFFAPQSFTGSDWLPFLDLRGHVFDNGKLAANTGLGIRYRNCSRLFGLNAYYDYLNTTHKHFNQVSIGLETIGVIFDFRINGYLPVGDKQSSFYKNSFAYFKRNNLYVERTRTYALKGFNAEVGTHIDRFQKAPLYFTAGSYYLTSVAKTTWGGEVRASVDLWDRYLRVGANASYDHLFKWIGQANVSLNFAFGKKTKMPRRENNDRQDQKIVDRRRIQRVDRHEIIPTRKQYLDAIAFNPLTGQPYVFFFVDNTSASLGTFESPFPTLLEAQNASLPNQGIYVFPGNGTTTGMNTGITLKDSQLLLGASINHSLQTNYGTIVIPPLASSLPKLSNIAALSPVVTLANNNTIAGFYLNCDFGNGISGAGILNLFTDQNTYFTDGTDTNGIYLLNPSGQVTVSNSHFDGFTSDTSLSDGNGVYIELDSGNTLNSINSIGSSFSNITNTLGNNGGCGIFVNIAGGNLIDFEVSNSSFTNFFGNGDGIGVSVVIDSGLLKQATISECSFSEFSGSGTNACFINPTNNSTVDTVNFSNNSFNNFSESVILYGVPQNESVFSNFNASGNIFNNINNNSRCIAFQTFTNGTATNVNMFNNSFTNLTSSTTGINVANFTISSTISNVNLYDNYFNIISVDSFGIVPANRASGGAPIIENLTITNNVFETISEDSAGIQYFLEPGQGAITKNTISGCTFKDISDTSAGIYYPSNPPSVTFLDFSNNSFSGTSTVSSTGYAIYIEVTQSTTCLNFKDNTAASPTAQIPYFFGQTGGTFNRTDGSDSSTNTGEISISGTVNAPGSCSE
jgi:hypothetical protein